ncbi:MAG: glycosyltransferase family 2 protein [Bacilli bacterium]|nr:glycosyltransferase family 2 protein [Bacilli bacterium]
MKDELVSIIVPMYNSEKYLDECISSILSQDYKNIELILVDDGSTDGTLKKAKEYENKDGRVKVIHQKNSGVSTARNNGIKKSKGTYITFVDSDDFIASNFISYYVSLIKKYKSDIVLSRMPIKYRSTDVVEEPIISEKIDIISGKECALEMLYYKIFIASWNKLFRKSLLANNSLLFEEKLSFGEGFNFSIDAFLKSKKVCITSLKKYYYRVDNLSSVMTKFSLKQVYGSFDAIDRLKDKYASVDGELSMAIKYADWHTHFDSLNSIVGTKNIKNNRDLYKSVKKTVRSDAKYALKAPISRKEKMKGLMCLINPYFASRIVNKFRRRKFNKI